MHYGYKSFSLGVLLISILSQSVVCSFILLTLISICSLLVYRLEKAMAPHSSTLAWKIPWMEAPGRLQSMGSWRIGHDWATSLSLFTFMHRRRKWQPTPVFLPGESQGRGSLMGCRLWGRRVGHDWSDIAVAAAAAAAYILSQWSGTPASTQLVFCEICI